jgi:hypothetical protein
MPHCVNKKYTRVQGQMQPERMNTSARRKKLPLAAFHVGMPATNNGSGMSGEPQLLPPAMLKASPGIDILLLDFWFCFLPFPTHQDR